MKRKLLLMMFCLLLLMPVHANYQGKYDDVLQTIKDNYYGEVNDQQMEDELYRGMLNALDPHSVYLSAEDLKAFEESLSSVYFGIGVSVQEENGFIKITGVFEDTPAAAAGLVAGDVITAVAGESVKNKALEAVIPKIKGHVGTSVRLSVLKAGQSKPIDVDVMRAKIELKTVKHSLKDGYDVFTISSFGEKTAKELKDLMVTYPGKKGIVIDLRDNPGGSLEVVNEIADIFLEKGKIITSIEYGGKTKMYYQAHTPANSAKLAVLINENSASASELFAGAMQDHKRGIIVGEQSYGKGSVQTIFTLKDGSAIKLTIAKYMTPNGRSIHEIGIKPDILLDKEQRVNPEVLTFHPMHSLTSSHYGSKDIDTLGMQERLNYLQYPLLIDGKFGKASVHALKEFEAKHKLTVDGILDIKTKEVLQAEFLKAAEKNYDGEMEAAIRYLESH